MLADLTEQSGYGLLMMTTRKDPARLEQVVQYLLARNIEGMLLGPGIHLPAALRQLFVTRDIPIVHLGQTSGENRFACVDGAQIGCLGARHLLERGHQRIICWGVAPFTLGDDPTTAHDLKILAGE